MLIYFILFVLVVGLFIVKGLKRKQNWKAKKLSFDPGWRIILAEKVSFYNALDQDERIKFEDRIQEFLENVRVTGIQVNIDITDKLLIASSAIIPIFAFPNWQYSNLYEVLVYPENFNTNFDVSGPDRNVLGMVGTGYMEGKMILSKKALRHGFSNESDMKNTAIHEFVHLIDKIDGTIDGIPSLLLEKQYTIPWLALIQKKIEAIYEEKSDINPYGATNSAEFFAVISEYFFEKPKLLAKNHPKLYKLLEEIFEQKMASKNLNNKRPIIGRNSPCPCNSGLKFKKCCGKVHY